MTVKVQADHNIPLTLYGHQWLIFQHLQKEILALLLENIYVNWHKVKFTLMSFIQSFI